MELVKSQYVFFIIQELIAALFYLIDFDDNNEIKPKDVLFIFHSLNLYKFS